MTTDDIRAIALALEGVTSAQPVARTIAKLVRELDGADVPVVLRDSGFFRFFVVNGLIQAQRYDGELREFVLQALAKGVREFAPYILGLHDKSAVADARDEKRFFAWCIAQLIEIGFEMDGLLMTMKGDAASEQSAYELRRLRDDGPDAFADSPLFDDDEKRLWNAVFDRGGQPAIVALQQHFIERYQVPFIAVPEPDDAN